MPKAISPEGVHATAFLVSPDSQTVAAIGPDQQGYFYPVSGGEPRPIRGLEAGEQPVAWSLDGRSIYIYRPGELPAKVYRLDLVTGQKTFLRQLMPAILPASRPSVLSCLRRMPKPVSMATIEPFPISTWWTD